MSLRTTRLLVAVALLAAPVACKGADRPETPPATLAADSAHAKVAALLEREIAREMREQAVPALSIALVDSDRIVWARGFGTIDTLHRDSATAQTIYGAGSLSSLFTALGVTQLAEQHSLDLDAPVTRLIPTFHPRSSFGAPVTLRHLIGQRSGLV
ncbi:MAG: serine hydrolase domain-containing protein, partial [Gemmatimonadaceae bacterium]